MRDGSAMHAVNQALQLDAGSGLLDYWPDLSWDWIGRCVHQHFRDVLQCRAPGMSLQRVPLFVWMSLMTAHPDYSCFACLEFCVGNAVD